MNCYAYEGIHFLRNRHHEDCGSEGCAGCVGCPERHCGECRKGEHLAFGENTCPSCVGRVRAQLRSMVNLYAALPAEAVVKGVQSEAANLYGPYANPEAFSHRRVSIMAGRINAPLEEEDEHHPRLVLHRWVFLLAEDYGDTYDGSDTIASLVDWIDRRLHRIANDAGQDFGLLRREVGKVVGHLEAVLHDGEQVERGVPCPVCSADDDVPRAPRLVLRRNDRDRSGAGDQWVCGIDDAHRWGEADYRLRVGTEYRKHAAKLTATDIAKEHGVPEGTTRRWASGWTDKRGQRHEASVAKAGYDGQRRQLYVVADVIATRDTRNADEQAS